MLSFKRNLPLGLSRLTNVGDEKMSTTAGVFENTHRQATSPEVRLLHNKIHAQDIHLQQQTPEPLRPRFSSGNPEAGRNQAHEILLSTLKLLAANEPDEQSDESLIMAAQFLEKLYLRRPPETPDRVQELHNAALAYYLAGQYARAYVIMRGIEEENDTPLDLGLMRSMFLRNLSSLKYEAVRFLRNNYTDDALANAVLAGEMGNSEAINAALRTTLCRVYIHFYEYARTGEESHILQAVDLSRVAQELAIQLSNDRQMRDWWWFFYTTVNLLREYHRNSLWTQLRPMIERDHSGLVEEYIKTSFARSPLPILELWRSQAHAVEYIQGEDSYCLKMPTSAGKTRIAELAILRFLSEARESPDKKCIYVAPYRALAVEIEASLKQSFGPLGIGVSQLYGSYDLNPAEISLSEQSRILVGTPEKLDAVMRYSPEIAQEIGLVIVDEGHIIDAGDRGLRYELFIQRLVRRYRRRGARILFISAVMPNVEQFSEWITGRSGHEGIIESNWRPSQQMIGMLTWNGSNGRIDFLYRDLERLDEDFFITNYLTSFNKAELQAAGLRSRRFPRKNASKGIILALAAVRAANEGATYVYAPQIRLVEGIAESLLEVIKIQKTINALSSSSVSVLPVSSKPEDQAKLQQCIEYAEECTGKDSLVVRGLKNGFVVHHGDVPRALRISLEELVRDGILQLVIATNTLAQGVNLPVRTVLIHSLQQGPSKTLSSRDFWNICGRAGRAMKETEGFVLLVNDTSQCKTPDEAVRLRRQAEQTIRDYVEQATGKQDAEQISSAVRVLLENLVGALSPEYPAIEPPDIAELCQALASNDLRWLEPSLKKQLDILDAQLLALTEEERLDEVDINRITEIFQDSLLRIQLNNPAQHCWLTYEDAISLIVQRIRVIFDVCRTTSRRRSFYSMGISVSDCVAIENRRTELVEYLQNAQRYKDWSAEERADYVVGLCVDFLMQLEDVAQTEDELPDCWPQILKRWLMGQNADQIASWDTIPNAWQDAMRISTLIDDLCEFRLPWGLNAITMFLQTPKDGTDELTLPEVIAYFPAMLRFGVHDPVATILLTLGLWKRQAALALATVYKGKLELGSILGWLQTIGDDLIQGCADELQLREIIRDFIRFVQPRQQPDHAVGPVCLEISVPSNEQVLSLTPNTTLISQIEGESVHLLISDSVTYLATISLDDPILLSKLRTSETGTRVKSIQTENGIAKIALEIG